MSSPRVIRLGLIGTGKHGVRYARHIRDDCPDAQLVAIARRDAAKAAALAEEVGVRAYTDYRELIAREDLDAVIVVVPPGFHADIVTCAAQARLPILLEKPAATSVAAGEMMRAALHEQRVPLMVAHTLRYNAVVRAVLAARASIGTIHSLSLTQRFEPSPLDWIDDPERSGGGMALHTGVHLFDLLHVLTGLEPEAVTCQMERVNTRRTEDSFVATVRLGGGAVLASVCCARTTGGRTGHIELSGERATLVGDHVLHQAYQVVGTRMEPLATGQPVPTVREAVRDFVRALRERAPMPITLDDGLRAVAVAEACYAAARSGGTALVRRSTAH